MTRFSLLALMIIASLGLASTASAQRTVAFFEGRTSGTIDGGSTVAGYEGWHDVSLMRHEVTSPRDPSSGLPTGRRSHGTVRLRLPESVGSVRFHTAQARNEVLSSVQIVAMSADGTTRYTIDLENAVIARVRTAWSADEGVVYEIELAYERITWTHEPGGTTATDTTTSPTG